GAGGDAGAGVAPGARNVLDVELRAEPAAEPLRDQAGQDVGPASRREGHDHPDRPGGPAGVGAGGCGPEGTGRGDGGGCETEDAATNLLHDLSPWPGTVGPVDRQDSRRGCREP